MSIEHKCMFFKREERKKKISRIAFRADHLFNLLVDEMRKALANANIIGIETVIDSLAMLACGIFVLTRRH